ncbi:MAG: PHB depolymerase family esterase, partial [Candidatus Sericytochromatia bacterium]|nr:PHB depolymerase family esterase [Candidatus Tanganyikabacteria bacterium]
ALALAGCGVAPQAPLAERAAADLAARAGKATTGTHQGRAYRLFEPPGAAGKAVPLVVMLHGCGQGAAEIAEITRFDALAAREGFAVLYPEQSGAAHLNRCWRWFDPADQARGRGEPGSIRGMVDAVAAKRPLDRDAVYVSGLSAGGAMAGIVAAAYPDVFAAAGVAAGLEVRAAASEAGAWFAMSMGGPDPLRLAPQLVDAMGQNRRAMPVMAFHGTLDYVVKPVNGEQVVAQWRAVDDRILRETGGSVAERAETQSGQAPGGHRFERELYRDHAGRGLLERYAVAGMAHAWPGGASGHAFSDPAGPDATRLMWAFFKANRKV